MKASRLRTDRRRKRGEVGRNRGSDILVNGNRISSAAAGGEVGGTSHTSWRNCITC
jgi:hypothetical protein